MIRIELVHASCADQAVDVVVNAANDGLWAGGGICGVIFRKAGMAELTDACGKYDAPLYDGDAVITPAFKMKNAKAIIHAVGPNFAVKPKAFKDHIGIYPGGEATTEFADRLTEYRISKGTIQLPYDKELPLDLIRDIVKWCYIKYAK